MKCFSIVLLALLAIPSLAQQAKDMYPRLAKAQKYASEGFTPIDCFAGQVKVLGKRIMREPVSVFLPDDNRKSCVTLVTSARTDHHGHFVLSPMRDGADLAQIQFSGAAQ